VRKTRFVAVLAGAVLVFVLAACTTKTPVSESSKPRNKTTAPDKPANDVSTDKSKLLTVADVTKVTGIQGVRFVARGQAKGAGGDLNFAMPDGHLLLLVVVMDNTSTFETWKKLSVDQVSGVGDEAFSGPKNMPEPYNLYVRSNGQSISIASFFDYKPEAVGKLKPLLTIGQLTELAKIVVSRL